MKSTMLEATGAREARRQLVELLRTESSALRLVVLFAMGVGLAALATPVAVQALVSSVAFAGLLQPVLVVGLLLLMCLSVGALLRLAQAWVAEIIQRRLFARVAAHIAASVGRRPSDGARAPKDVAEYLPEKVNRLFETFTLQKATAAWFLGGVEAVLTVGVGCLVLAFYHPALLAFDIVLLAGLYFVVFGMGRNGTRTAIDESHSKYDFVAWVQARARQVAINSGAVRPASRDVRLEALADEYLQMRSAHYRVVLRQIGASLVLQVLANVTLLCLGAFLVLKGQLTVGQLVAAEIVVTGVVAAVARLGKHIESFYDAVAAVAKLNDLANAVDGKEQDENRVVAHRSAREPLLAVVTLPDADGGGSERRVVAKPGEVAVVRLPVGATSDGLIASLPRDAHVVRGVALLPGTILENVVGFEAITPRELARAERLLAAVGFDATARELRAGLETMVEVDGSPLRGEAPLLLQFATILFRPPAVLVIDGIADSLTADALIAVLRAVRAFAAGTSVILVTRSVWVERKARRAAEPDGRLLVRVGRTGDEGDDGELVAS